MLVAVPSYARCSADCIVSLSLMIIFLELVLDVPSSTSLPYLLMKHAFKATGVWGNKLKRKIMTKKPFFLKQCKIYFLIYFNTGSP
jgi:hypothetical protein